MKSLKILVAIIAWVNLLVPAVSHAGSMELFRAVTNGDISTVKVLLDRGENVNAVEEKYGITPLHMSSYQGNTELVHLLIDRGANISAKDKEGEMPIHAASNNDKWHVVAILLTKGADVNAYTNQGWTPLHYAASIGSKKVATLLIGKGANIKARTSDGRTPLDLAAEKGNKEMIELLKNQSSGAERDLVGVRPHIPYDSMTTKQLYDLALEAGIQKDFNTAAILLNKAKIKDASNMPVAIAFSLAKEAVSEKIPPEAGVSVFRSVQAGNIKNWDLSLTEAKKASDIAQESASVFVHLGTVYVGFVQANRGDYYANDAITAYRKAVVIDPNCGLAHYNLGVALAAKRDWEKAKYHLEKAKTLGISQAQSILSEVEKRMPKSEPHNSSFQSSKLDLQIAGLADKPEKSNPSSIETKPENTPVSDSGFFEGVIAGTLGNIRLLMITAATFFKSDHSYVVGDELNRLWNAGGSYYKFGYIIGCGIIIMLFGGGGSAAAVVKNKASVSSTKTEINESSIDSNKKEGVEQKPDTTS